MSDKSIVVTAEMIRHPESTDWGKIWVEKVDADGWVNRSPLRGTVREAIAAWIYRYRPDATGWKWAMSGGMDKFRITWTEDNDEESQ